MPTKSLTPNLVSIALSARNAEDTIVDAAQSLLQQTHENVELFIVDDASTDQTAEKVRDEIKDSRATLIQMSENIGTYAAKNLVLKHFVQGEWYAHQDADDVSHPTRFEKQLQFLQNHEHAACGTGIDEFFEDPSINPRFSVGIPATLNEEDGYYHKDNLYPAELHWESLYAPETPVTELKIAMNGSLLFRAGVVFQLGGFDSKTQVGADSELLLRMSFLTPIANLQEVLYSRKFHHASLTGNTQTGFQSDYRQKYIDALEKKRSDLRETYQRQGQEGVLPLIQYELQTPKVAFQVFPLV